MESSAYDELVGELCALVHRGQSLVADSLSCSIRAPLKNHAITEHLMGTVFILANPSGFEC